MQRIGGFVGPFLGAVAVTAVGIDGAYYVHITRAASVVVGALGFVGAALVAGRMPEPLRRQPPARQDEPEGARG